MSTLTQREKNLLEQIGENAVLLMLALKLKRIPGWKAYKTVSNNGNDLIVSRVHGKPKPGRKKNFLIEVKARQLIDVSGATNHAVFSVSAKERDDCDFLVAYWFDYNHYFVVPKNDLKPTRSKSTGQMTGYYFIASFDKSTRIYDKTTAKYLDAWDRITSRLT